MKTEVLAVSSSAPEPELIRRTAAVLRGGGLVAFPTETVYGLGANALDAAACARIFAAKGRPANNPIIVHVADIESARQIASTWPEIADLLARRFWPGPLTLVLPKSGQVPSVVTAGGPTVAVRVPAHPVALALLREAGIPIAAPSANRSTQLSPTCADHVLQGLDGRIDLLLDGGPASGGLESTVMDVSRHPPVLLRPGLISSAELEAVVGTLVLLNAALPLHEMTLPSPGMLPRHYAPHTPLVCVEGDGTEEVAQRRARGQRVAWVRFGKSDGEAGAAERLVEMPGEAAPSAARLYAVLHELDAALLDVIVVEMPPDAPAWAAIWDRLRRAATD